MTPAAKRYHAITCTDEQCDPGCDWARARTVVDVARRTFPFMPTEPNPADRAYWDDDLYDDETS